MPGANRSRTISALSASLLLALLATTAYAQIRLDLPVQPLGQSITAVGTLGHLNVMFDPSVVDGLQAPALKAELSADEALGKLLSGTKLHAVRVNANTIRVIAEPVSKRAQTSGASETGIVYAPATVRLVYVDSTSNQTQTESRESGPPTLRASDMENREAPPLEQIVITGTKIRGSEPASRVSVYSRTEIEQQGFGTLKDFIQSLPQNFNGGASENTIGGVTGAGGSSNIVSATGVNLRGLGNDATLVLFDGQRVAPANWRGNFVDISMIPLSGIERVEVMPDGASAIYGSDAVGGVVNFVLRKNLDGAETTARYGSVTEGGRNTVDLSQAFGHNWQTGSALLAYNFEHATPLFANARSYTAQTTQEPFTLLPKQQKQSALLTGRQGVGSNVQLFGDAMFSHRDAFSELAGSFTFPNPQDQRYGTDAYSGILGARAGLSDTINFEMTSNYSGNQTRYRTTALSKGTPFTNERIRTDLLSVDAKIDGEIIRLAAGPVLFALGGQYRRETYDFLNLPDATSRYSAAREIKAAFLELHVPLFGPYAGSDKSVLELQVAGRYEHYSDFGSTENPKVGLIWRPRPDTTLRANYSTSFVAPLLADLNPTLADVEADAGADYGPDAPDVVYIAGGNPHLKPQKSRNWTIGAEFNSQDRTGVHAHVDYYNISYTDRITNALSLSSFYGVFQNESILGPNVVVRNPSPAYLQVLESSPIFVNYDVADLATVGALIDDRKQNLSSVKTDGIDFGATYNFDFGRWNSEAGLDGNYIVKYDNQFSPSAPVTSFLNTAYNPVDLRLRARGLLARGPNAAGIYVNYVNSYRNQVDKAYVPVASWLTVDLTASYDLKGLGALPISDATVRLGVTNLLDRAPPYVANARANGINFDGANANAVGRFLYIEVLGRW